MKSEHHWLTRLPSLVGPPLSDSRVILGIGDDAAVLSPSDEPFVWTVDACVENVHFTRAILSFEDIGYRSLMAAASDVAAMAAVPRAMLSALTAPGDIPEQDLNALVRGQCNAAKELSASLIGGNITRAPVLSVTTTVLAETPHPLLRSGVQPGDSLWVKGPLGHAAVGLRALLLAIPQPSPALLSCIEAWRRPRARIEDGLAIRTCASAAIDISDGLAQDAGHLAAASGVQITLDATAVLAAGGPTLLEAAHEIREDPLHLALTGGEDYLLLASSHEDLSGLGFLRIGYASTGQAEVLVLRDGKLEEAPNGFDHFQENLGPILEIPHRDTNRPV